MLFGLQQQHSNMIQFLFVRDLKWGIR